MKVTGCLHQLYINFNLEVFIKSNVTSVTLYFRPKNKFDIGAILKRMPKNCFIWQIAIISCEQLTVNKQIRIANISEIFFKYLGGLLRLPGTNINVEM